ncbi:MAG: hypothetical protein LUF84_05755 [Clostridiales bacterium]|nr:hypothetical protein [Clostridiales bacterium]
MAALGKQAVFAGGRGPPLHTRVQKQKLFSCLNSITGNSGGILRWLNEVKFLFSRSTTVSRIVKQLKGTITKQLGYSVWQRSFYDHILRNEDDYLLTVQYIDENPLKWEFDPCHPPTVQRIP